LAKEKAAGEWWKRVSLFDAKDQKRSEKINKDQQRPEKINIICHYAALILQDQDFWGC
jgi:hypothetical protein